MTNTQCLPMNYNVQSHLGFPLSKLEKTQEAFLRPSVQTVSARADSIWENKQTITSSNIR